MDAFHYERGSLFIENVSVEEIAADIGSPFYAYSYRSIIENFDAFAMAFRSLPHLVCFAVKANNNPAILRILAKKGGGADVVSGGELFEALQAGIGKKKIVFAGVGKQSSEIREALNTGILMFNVESMDELALLDKIASKIGTRAPFAFRINLDVDSYTHPYISTGLQEHKFGVKPETAMEGYRKALSRENLAIVGVHMHIGSQITTLEPFTAALEKLIKFIRDLRKEEKVKLQFLDIGGGLGINYHREEAKETPPTPQEFAEAITPLINDLGLKIILEPGRAIVGKAGILVTSVLRLKNTGKKNFVVVDAGMNDLIRPSLYNAHHEIWPVKKMSGRRKTMVADIVGPVCETGDFLARARSVPVVKHGDLLAVMDVGAYGFAMSSNYNSRPRAPEVLVKENEHFIIRRRESYKDLVRNVNVPSFLC